MLHRRRQNFVLLVNGCQRAEKVPVVEADLRIIGSGKQRTKDLNKVGREHIPVPADATAAPVVEQTAVEETPAPAVEETAAAEETAAPKAPRARKPKVETAQTPEEKAAAPKAPRKPRVPKPAAAEASETAEPKAAAPRAPRKKPAAKPTEPASLPADDADQTAADEGDS